MSEISERYARLSAAYTAKIEGVPADRWQSSSPCEEWTALDLVRHVVDSQNVFLGFVGRKLDDVPPVDDDPAAGWNVVRGAVQAELDDPERVGAGSRATSDPRPSRTPLTASSTSTSSPTHGTWSAPPGRTNGSTLRTSAG